MKAKCCLLFSYIEIEEQAFAGSVTENQSPQLSLFFHHIRSYWCYQALLIYLSLDSLLLVFLCHPPFSQVTQGCSRRICWTSTPASNMPLIKAAISFCPPRILYCFRITTYIGLGNSEDSHLSCTINTAQRVNFHSFCVTILDRRSIP